MSAKTANALLAVVIIAALAVGSHVDGQVSMCVNLGGEWQGQGLCRL